MPRKRKLLNLRDRCRLCLTENGEMRDLFTEPYCLKLKDLSDCTSIQIKCEQNLPKNICHACIYKLEMWNEFKERFMRSNRLLLTRLEGTDTNDNSATLPKRKFVAEQASSDENKKKHKISKSPVHVVDLSFEDKLKNEIELKPSPLNSMEKSTFDDSTNAEKDIENNVSSSSKLSNSSKYRQISRRGRTTERRKASTRRWVARKKALIAATGNNSDTDSGVSDNQLSPVQKARAKSNADKEEEKQKKVARALKNLETDLNEYKKESDSDVKRILRSRRSNVEETKPKTPKPIAKPKDTEKSKVKEKDEKENETEKENMSAPPRTVKSELRIGDTTYIVTSTLAISEPAHFDKVFHDSVDQDKVENTDIIDAVQLKRVGPVSNSNKDNQLLEKCLHIEIEGTEFEALQRVQVDLASFIEKDMKSTLFTDSGIVDNIKSKLKGSYDNLDQQLKTIVVKAIKKNYEISMQNDNYDSKDEIIVSKSVSLEFAKAAMHSSVFQPKLILARLDISKVLYKINNIELLQTDIAILQNSNKKMTCLPSIEDSFGDNERNRITEIDIVKREKPRKIIKQKVESVECDTTTHQETQDLNILESFNSKEIVSSKGQNILKTYQKKGLNHRCTSCNRSFTGRNELDQHMKDHHDTTQKNREKLMRCKRCHEIVAAKFVKSHICTQPYKCGVCGISYISEKAYIIHMKSHDDSQALTNVQLHKCTICDKPFKSEMQLIDHLSIHDNQKSKFDCHECNISFISQQSFISHLQTHNRPVSEISSKLKNVKSKEKQQDISENVSNFEKRTLASKLDKKSGIESPKPNVLKKHEGYTCFVCDKKFSDEEVMKDHLQQHCDDISEEEQNAKEIYQCAICSESLESEDALSTHVENHLFDDGDDNPNLISITDCGKPKEVKYYCDQCPEEFSSKSILAMHKEIHDEETDIMEWEKQTNLVHSYSCTICDEIFSTQSELAEHFDIHNENSHICLLCEKSFSTLLDLQAHVETH